MNAEKLVKTANHIGTFFSSQKGDETVHAIADHIRKYWDPRMRASLLAHLDSGGEGLAPEVRRAAEEIAREKKAQA